MPNEVPRCGATLTVLPQKGSTGDSLTLQCNNVEGHLGAHQADTRTVANGPTNLRWR